MFPVNFEKKGGGVSRATIGTEQNPRRGVQVVGSRRERSEEGDMNAQHKPRDLLSPRGFMVFEGPRRGREMVVQEIVEEWKHDFFRCSFSCSTVAQIKKLRKSNFHLPLHHHNPHPQHIRQMTTPFKK